VPHPTHLPCPTLCPSLNVFLSEGLCRSYSWVRVCVGQSVWIRRAENIITQSPFNPRANSALRLQMHFAPPIIRVKHSNTPPISINTPNFWYEPLDYFPKIRPGTIRTKFLMAFIIHHKKTSYGVATISRLLKMICLFGRISSLL